MRIYAVADIHGKKRYLNAIKKAFHIHHPDIVVMAGDLCGMFSCHRLIPFLIKIMVPVVYIPGNSDFNLFNSLKRSTLSLTHIRMLDDHPFLYNNFHFTGAGGTLPLPFASRIAIKEKQVLNRLAHQLTPDTILVVHPPPRGILDRAGNRFSAGSRNLRHFIDIHQPFMVICGHIHEQAGFAWSGRTLVVNCAVSRNSLGAIIDISQDMTITVSLLNPDGNPAPV